MNYNWKFAIPVNRTQSNLYVQVKRVTYGRIQKVTINNPAGSVGKSHLRVFYHEWQLYPLNKGDWYEGEQINVSFEDNYNLHSAPYELKFKGWNESLLYSHAFYINITIMREEPEGGIGETLQLSGMEGEIKV